MNKNLITSGRTRRKKPTVSTIFNGDVYYGDIDGENSEALIDSPFAIASDMNADGTVIVVGQVFHSSATQVGVGVVRVYNWNSTAWVQKGGDIIPSDASYNVGGKVQISADGNTVVFTYQPNVVGIAMALAWYEYNGAQWINKQLPLVTNNGRIYDIALSADASTALVGNTVYNLSTKTTESLIYNTYGSNVSCNINANATVITLTNNHYGVTVYKKTNGVWAQFGPIISGDDLYYSSISNDGNTITSGDFVSVTVYDLVNGAFTLRSAQKIPSYYTSRCDFNEDATMIIVANAQQGSCDVYKWDAIKLTWDKYGNSIATYSNGGRSLSGASVSISNDGNKVLISTNNYYQYDGGIKSDNLSPQAYQYNASTKNWDKLGGPILANTMIGKPWHSADISADGSIVAYGLSNLVCSDKLSSDSMADTAPPQYSKVCIYNKTTGVKTYINPPNDRSGFGWKIALNDAGDTFITSTLNDAGVFVYKKTAGVWAKLGNTIASVAGSNNSVSINAAGDRVAVCRVNAVDVYIYTVGSNTWTLLGSSISAAGVKDVSLNANIGTTDGNYIAIAYSSRISVYSYISGAWSVIGNQFSVFASRSAGWAYSISINAAGNRVAVGCSDASATVFSWDGNAWTQISKDEFALGHIVSLNAAGDRLLVGYPTLDTIGMVGLYWWNGREWISVLNRRHKYYAYGDYNLDYTYWYHLEVITPEIALTGINDIGSICKLNADGKKFLVGSQRRGLDYAVSTR